MEERGENTLGHVVPNHLIGVRGAEVAAESCWQTPHGTFGCGQAEKALLRTRHFDVLGKGIALFPARPTQPGLSHLEATLSVQGKGRFKSSISGGDSVSLQLGGHFMDLPHFRCRLWRHRVVGQDACSQQVESGATIHLAFDGFKSVDLTFNLAVAPRSLNCCDDGT